MCSEPKGRQMVMLPCQHMLCRGCMANALTDRALCRVCNPGRKCECGAARPEYWLSGRGQGCNLKLWCKDCPGRPLEAVNQNKKARGGGNWRDGCRLCECGSTAPRFAPAGSTERRQARFCRKCRPEGAVDVKSRRCPCGHLCCYALPGQPRTEAAWCSKCPNRPVEAINLVLKTCRCGSGKTCTLGILTASGKVEGKGGQKWCVACPDIPPNSAPLGKRLCECNLKKQATFAPAGGGYTDARWCAKCTLKPANAISVVAKRCSCGRAIPTFRLPNMEGSGPVWCVRCPDKPPEAVNITNRRCSCGKGNALYGLPSDTQVRKETGAVLSLSLSSSLPACPLDTGRCASSGQQTGGLALAFVMEY